MANLSGTVIASTVYKTSSGERLTLVLDAPCGATAVALADATKGRPDNGAPRELANLTGRTITIAVDDSSLQVTSISIT